MAEPSADPFNPSTPTSMISIQVSEFGDPSVLKSVPSPLPTCSPGEVLVSMRAAGVNPVETYIRSGKYAKLPTLPFTPGGEGAGYVQSVGEGITRFQVGQRVYIAGCKTGSYAQFALCKESTVFPLPDNVTFVQGACIGTAYATAHRALFRAAHCCQDSKVLVHGASGGVGLAAVQLAKAAGCFVIGSASTPEGRDMCKSAGCDETVDHSNPAHLDEVKAMSGGQGVDIIVEMLANVNLGVDLPALAVGGRVAIVGSRGPVEINPRDLMQKEASIIGVANAFQHENPSEAAAMHASIYSGLESGALKPVVASTKFNLSDAASAHKHITSGSGAQGKVVLEILHTSLERTDSSTEDALQ